MKLQPYHLEYQEDGFEGHTVLLLTEVAYSNYSMQGGGVGC